MGEPGVQPKPQQLATAIKQGRKLEFSSCPLTVALNLLREQWGSGQVRIRVIIVMFDIQFVVGIKVCVFTYLKDYKKH
jgi:hypothetical protein